MQRWLFRLAYASQLWRVMRVPVGRIGGMRIYLQPPTPIDTRAARALRAVQTPAATVSAQWLAPHVAALRYHPRGGSYGAPYSFVCTLVIDEAGTGELIAGAGDYSAAVRRVMRAKLRELGVPVVRWEKRNSGEARALSRNVN